jgi:hypothetical protein
VRLQRLRELVFGGLRRFRWHIPAMRDGLGQSQYRNAIASVRILEWLLLRVGRIEDDLVVPPQLLKIISSDWRGALHPFDDL